MNYCTGLRSLVVLAMTLGTACGLEPLDSGVGAYRQDFTRSTKQPFLSEIAADKLIEVWISPEAAAEYSRVLLDGEGSGVKIPEGTVIIREVRDTGGTVESLTLMVKGAPGYFPGGGDWWYGVADPDGQIRLDASGEPRMGRLEDCGGCHLSRPQDDYLFGIPSGYHAL